MIIVVEQGKLLLPIGIIVGVITVKYNKLRFSVIRSNKGVYQFFAYVEQVFLGGCILQAAHGRLRAKSTSALRQPLTAHLEDSIFPDVVTVVTVFIACSNLVYPLSKQFFHAMVGVPVVSPVTDAVADAVN